MEGKRRELKNKLANTGVRTCVQLVYAREDGEIQLQMRRAAGWWNQSADDALQVQTSYSTSVTAVHFLPTVRRRSDSINLNLIYPSIKWRQVVNNFNKSKQSGGFSLLVDDWVTFNWRRNTSEANKLSFAVNWKFPISILLAIGN